MIQRERLLATFLDLVRIPSPSGQEERVADALAQRQRSWGLQPQRDAIGNLWARLEGEGEPLLLTAHMDTVGPAVQINPVLRDGVIYSDGTTILGADDKAGIAIIMAAARHLLTYPEIPHGPIRIGFTPELPAGFQGAVVLSSDAPIVAVAQVGNNPSGSVGVPGGTATAFYQGIGSEAASTRR